MSLNSPERFIMFCTICKKPFHRSTVDDVQTELVIKEADGEELLPCEESMLEGLLCYYCFASSYKEESK
jgi:hypothetical protein